MWERHLLHQAFCDGSSLRLCARISEVALVHIPFLAIGGKCGLGKDNLHLCYHTQGLGSQSLALLSTTLCCHQFTGEAKERMGRLPSLRLVGAWP